MATEELLNKMVDLNCRSATSTNTTSTSSSQPSATTLLNLMSTSSNINRSTAVAPEYYNDFSSILQSSTRSSPASVSQQRAQTPSGSKASSQATSPLSRDSPFFPGDPIPSTSNSASATTPTVYSTLQGNTLEPLTTATAAQHRFPSTLSNEDHSSVLKSAIHSRSPSNSGSMVAIDFSVLARNFPATVGGLKSSMSISNGLHQHQMIYQHHQQQHHQHHQQHYSYNPYQPPNGYSASAQQQQQQAYNGVYSSQYAGTNSLYSTTGTSRSHEEDIYEDLCYVTLRSSREREKALGTLLLEPIEKRDYCIKELVETEKNYCEALRMIVNHFYKPLAAVLHLEDRRLIFNNLKSLTDLHSRFYNELCRACSQTPNGIGAASSANSSFSSQSSTTQQQQQQSNSSTTPTNLIPSASMPSLSLIGGCQNSGAMTNSAYVGDGSTTTLSTTLASTTIQSSSSGVQQSSNWSFNSSLSSSTSTLLYPSLNGLPGTTSTFSSTTCNGSTPNSNNSPTRLSAVFLAFKDKFLIYGDYCANLPKAQALLDELTTRDETVGSTVARCQNKANDGKFKLRDLLSLPMQRILKYHLLLGELIRSTTESHEDYSGLKEAHDVMLDIGGYINEVKRDTETLEIIRDVQRSIVDLSMPDNYELKDYGRLLKDGEVRVRCNDDPRLRLKNRYVFIFDKVVLMCKALRGLQYCYKDALILEDFKIEEICSPSPISKLTKQWSHGWVLCHSRTKQMYTFFVKTDDAKRKWLEAIERAQENVRPKDLQRTDHKFAMSTVPVATYCACCSKILRGTWYQGYLCTVCNVSVHKGCIASVKACGSCSVMVPGTTAISVRKDSLVHSSSSSSSTEHVVVDMQAGTSATAANLVTLRKNAAGLRLNGTIGTTYRSQVTRSLHYPTGSGSTTAPPTPSKTKRTIAKAIATNYGGGPNGQLAFLPNDTIIVFSKHGTASWFGRNVRTEEEGTFSASLVTELATDSPTSSSLESPGPVGPHGPLRFSYEDPFNSSAEMQQIAQHNHHHQQQQQQQHHFAFPNPLSSAATLPRKFSNASSTGTPSPQHAAALMLMPSSPLAASTPVLNTATGASNSSGNAQQSNIFNFNADAEATSTRLIFGNGYNLEEYVWFAGNMDRDMAQATLSPMPHGCFLVRISPRQRNSYAISIKYNGSVKHMRVCVTEQAGITPTTVHSNLNSLNSPTDQHSKETSAAVSWPYKTHFYLSETRYFRTIVDLVRWYELNSLSESFNMVNTPLLLPYKKAYYCAEVLGQAVALYSFTANSTANGTFLSLKKGDQVTVYSRQAEDKGWWRGTIADRFGFFPFKYVSSTSRALSVIPSGEGDKSVTTAANCSTSQTTTTAQQTSVKSLYPVLPVSLENGGLANTTATTVDSLSISSAMTETSNLSPTGDQSFLSTGGGGAVSDSPLLEDHLTKDHHHCSPSVSPSSFSSSASSASSSPTTQSSPVNSVESGHSDTSSLHSRQPSSDAGIEVPPFSGANQSPPPPLQPPPTLQPSTANTSSSSSSAVIQQQQQCSLNSSNSSPLQPPPPVTCFSSLSQSLTHPPGTAVAVHHQLHHRHQASTAR